MRILHISYTDYDLATMIRSVELARAASMNGAHVRLCFLNRNFSPAPFLKDVMDAYAGERLEFVIDRADAFDPPPKPRPSAENTQPASEKPTRTTSRITIMRAIASSARFIRRELELIDEFKPDVVVARPDLSFSFLLSTRLRKIPLVLSTDGVAEELEQYYGIRSPFLIWLDAWRLRQAQAVLVISNVVKQLILKKRVEPDRVFLCPNGVDPDFFKPQPPEETRELRKKLGLENGKVVGFSGNQVAYHGVGGLLSACITMLEDDPDVHLLIIGDIKAPEALGLDRLPQAIREKQIHFTGRVPYFDMPKYVDCADVLVMPYPRHDLFFWSPMKLFENIAMNKLIVASDQGQISEILSNCDKAFLYDPDDPESLTRRITEALAAFSENPSSEVDSCAGHHWIDRGREYVNACLKSMNREQAPAEQGVVTER